MSDLSRFNGVFTALVTPFTQTGTIDWPAFDALVDRQIAAGIAGLVPVGTTGEAATLTERESLEIIERTARRADGRVYVLAGTGSNATAKAVEATRRATDAGADGVLVVTPYYNRPTQDGLVAHFTAVAEATTADVMLYSVPGRAAVSIAAETAASLARSCRNIVAIKEAGGDAQRVTELRAACGPDFAVHCGDDGLALAFYALGASGLTSVLSNYAPKECVDLYQAWATGDIVRARMIHEWLAPLVKALFVESSPGPVKRALSLAGYMRDTVRLPLVGLSEPAARILAEAVERHRVSAPAL